MKHLVFGLMVGLCLAPAVPAMADVNLINLLPQAFKVGFQQQNGQPMELDMQPRTGANVGSIPAGNGNPNKTIPVTLKDDMGASVWSGAIANNRCAVVYKDAAGKIQCTPLGWFLDNGQTKPQAVVLVNFTGKPLKFDFFGQGQQVGAKDVAVTASIDPTTPTRLPQGDQIFYVTIKDGSGGALNTPHQEYVSAGDVDAVFTADDGTVHVHSLGFIKAPLGH